MQSSVKKLQAVKQLSSQDKVTKFEFLIDLQRMDAKIDKTSIFRAQIRLVGVFKQMSKKYEVVQPHQDGQTLEALIEFQKEDNFSKSTIFQKAKDGSFQPKNVLLEIICNDEVVSTNEINLTNYIECEQATPVKLELEGSVASSLEFTIKMWKFGDPEPMLDNFKQGLAQKFGLDMPKIEEGSSASHSTQNTELKEEMDKLKVENANLKNELEAKTREAYLEIERLKKAQKEKEESTEGLKNQHSVELENLKSNLQLSLKMVHQTELDSMKNKIKGENENLLENLKA